MTTETTAPPVPEVLAADAARLRPKTAANQALLRALREHAGQAVEKRVRAALREASEILGATETRVVFAGHFSSGKSSVINTLIGRPLLPSSRFPETGVPCLLRVGDADKIVVVPVQLADGTREVPLTTEQIAEAVKLIGEDGAHRASVLAIDRLDVTLVAGPVPVGTVWVDSPGSNDTGAMNDRAQAAAAQADALVWVINSRQPVSEVEQGLLAAHLAAHGPASVVFLVNAFLTEDSPDGWDEFLTEDMPVISARIADFIDTGAVAKSVVVVSARAAAKSRDQYAGYGGADARALVTSLSNGTGDGWRVPATRRFRAALRLGEIDEWLSELIKAERDRLTAERADRAAMVDRAARFTAAVQRRVEQVVARRRADASEAVTAAVAAARAGSGAAPAATLEAALRGIWDQIAAEVAAAVREEAEHHGQHAPAKAALATKIKATGAANVAVNGGSGGDGTGVGGALAGAGVGLVVGSVVPVIGHVIGVGVGAAWGFAKARKGRQQQRDFAVTQIEKTGNAAVSALTGSDAVQVITRVATEACADAVPPQPGEEKLTALRNAQLVLTGYADELRDVRP